MAIGQGVIKAGVVVGMLFAIGTVVQYYGKPDQPASISEQGSAIEQVSRRLIAACGSPRDSEQYRACLDRESAKLVATTPKAPVPKAYRPDYGPYCQWQTAETGKRSCHVPEGVDVFKYKSETGMGYLWDSERDALYLISMQTGNATRCGVIDNIQAQRIMEGVYYGLTLDMPELHLRSQEYGQRGAAMDNCGYWTPEHIDEEQRLIPPY